MLTQNLFAELYGRLRDQKVLSIYVDGEEHDPAERKVWRTRMEQQLTECRRRVQQNGAGDEEAFEAAAEHLMSELSGFTNFMPERGWVGFATADGVEYADTVPVPMPDQVVWETGPRAAPYVRGLKQERPVVVALADRHRARIFTYIDGQVTETDDLDADRSPEDVADPDLPERGTEYAGSRDKVGTDAAQRAVEVKAERMLKRAVERVVERVGSEGLVVVGGTRETGARLMHHLPSELQDRATEIQSLHLEMTDAEVKNHAEKAASELTQHVQESLVDEVLDLALSGGRGVLGDEGTADALTERRVDMLLLSRSFIQENPDHADRMVGTAFEQRARVEELSGPAAQRLDEKGKGVGARLRW